MHTTVGRIQVSHMVASTVTNGEECKANQCWEADSSQG